MEAAQSLPRILIDLKDQATAGLVSVSGPVWKRQPNSGQTADQEKEITMASPNPASPTSPLACLLDGAGNPQVYYLDNQGNVWQLYWNGSSWISNNVSSLVAIP